MANGVPLSPSGERVRTNGLLLPSSSPPHGYRGGRGKVPAAAAEAANLWSNLDLGLRLGIDALERQGASATKRAADSSGLEAASAQLVEVVDALRRCLGRVVSPSGFSPLAGDEKILAAEAAMLRSELADAKQKRSRERAESSTSGTRETAAQAQLDLLMELEQTRAQVAVARLAEKAQPPSDSPREAISALLGDIAAAKKAEAASKAQLAAAQQAERTLRAELAALRRDLATAAQPAPASAADAAAGWQAVWRSRKELTTVREAVASAGNVQAELNLAMARTRQLLGELSSPSLSGINSPLSLSGLSSCGAAARPRPEDRDASSRGPFLPLSRGAPRPSEAARPGSLNVKTAARGRGVGGEPAQAGQQRPVFREVPPTRSALHQRPVFREVPPQEDADGQGRGLSLTPPSGFRSLLREQQPRYSTSSSASSTVPSQGAVAAPLPPQACSSVVSTPQPQARLLHGPAARYGQGPATGVRRAGHGLSANSTPSSVSVSKPPSQPHSIFGFRGIS